jgi:hypothetical protein
MKNTIIVLFLFLVTTCLAARCNEEGCPSIGCWGDVTIIITPEDGETFARDSYKIELVPGIGRAVPADGIEAVDEIICELNDEEAECDSPAGTKIENLNYLLNGKLQIPIDPGADSLLDEIHVTISSGGETLFDDTVVVDFETYYPNDIECAGKCTSAEINVAL